jgi:hypothetical protein
MAILGVLTDEGFLHLVGIFLLSGVKFLGGLIWAIAFIENDLIGWFVSALGGIFGSFIWIFLGHWIQDKWIQFSASGNKNRASVKRFSKKNRWLVRIKQKGGVYLLVFLAPLIISIPVGCLILTSMESNRYRLLMLMTISVLLWGTAMYCLYPYFM